ncbi:MAG: DUF1778 domain-containing protein [Massilia sp.]
MTTTITIRLPEDLKARISSAAERAGKTTHRFILEAIAEKAALEEARAGFTEEADARFAEMLATGNAIPWFEVRDYLMAHVEGKHVQRPVAKKHFK